MSIKLFIIATPIGNLSDLSKRSIEVLSDVDLIFAEDTRVTSKLLFHLGLKKKLLSCHKFNEQSRIDKLKEAFEREEVVALVSDAGTPLISDPGQRIVQEAIEIGFEICAIPGPTAFIQALIGSGLPADRFVFDGFLPDKESHLKKHLASLIEERRTLVFYVSPHGLIKRLAVIESVLGNRRACLAKELTKIHERYFRGNLNELPGFLNEENLRGEFTLIVEGQTSSASQEKKVSASELNTYIGALLEEKRSANEIAKLVKETYGMKKSDAYNLVLEMQGKR